MRNFLFILVVLCAVLLAVESCGGRGSCSSCNGRSSTKDRLTNCYLYKYYCYQGCSRVQETIRRLCPETCAKQRKEEEKKDRDNKQDQDKKDKDRKDETRKDEDKKDKKDESGSNSKFADAMLDRQNKYRKIHDVSSFKYNSKLAKFAQKHCDMLRNEKKFEHSKDSGYGENLGRLWYGKSNDPVASGISVVDAWYNEIKKPGYDFKKPGYKSGVGHFTQMVWKSSTDVGCAYSQNSAKNQIWVCCNYSPQGNYQSRFAENVLKGSYRG